MPNIKYAVIIHGKDGSPNTSWLPWLKRKLEAHDIDCEVPTFPPEGGSMLAAWLTILNDLQVDLKYTVFVSHARGAMALLRWINTLPPDTHIAQVIAVSCNFDHQPNRNSNGFYEQPLNFEDLKRKCGNFTVIHSGNDSYVPIEAGEQLATRLGAKFVRYETAGHFGSDKLEAPEILSEVIS
jgi:predicted alpha/beta hydrolase family esterase